VEYIEYEPKINSTGGLIPDSDFNENLNEQIQIQDVKFHYPTKKDVEVLKGITIDVSQNKVIALVGPSGNFI
jgi:ABC-type multidrug transport system fused ATPase/permease subunit